MLPNEYFTYVELSCRCGCGALPNRRSVERLYALRILFGKPIPVTSAARCRTHNATIGGSPLSSHIVDDFSGMDGGGFDCKIRREDEWEFIRLAQMCGFTGIGIKDNEYTHIDDNHKNPVIWTY